MTSKTTWLEFLALAAIWGSSFLFMRIGGVEFGVIPTAGVRVAIGALVLLPLLWFSGHWPALQRNALPVLFIGTLNSALPFALFAYAVTSITTGLSGILNAGEFVMLDIAHLLLGVGVLALLGLYAIGLRRL